MDQPHDHSHHHAGEPGHEPARAPFLKTPVGVAVAMVAVIAAFFLLREHWEHVLGSWSYLLLLACPLMHLFGHGGHGGHGGHHHGGGGSQPPSSGNKKDW